MGRAVMLGPLAGLDEVRKAALWSALSRSILVDGDGLSSATRGRARWRARLPRFMRRPEMVVTRGFRWASAAMALHRAVSNRVVFLLFLAEPPGRVGWLRQLILRVADGVLVDGEATARAASVAAFPAHAVYRIPPSHDLGPFLRVAPSRSTAESRRIVVVGDLDPGSGAADLLIAVMAWARLHPDEAVALCWVGDGDLSSVLAAQPLPPNASQKFAGRPVGAPGVVAIAATFARSGLLVVPSMLDASHAPVVEALAAGLLIVGSRQSREVRHLVIEGVNGWLFDPYARGSLLDCLTRALAASPQDLEAMRGLARASVAAPGTVARIRRRSPAAQAALTPLPGPAP